MNVAEIRARIQLRVKMKLDHTAAHAHMATPAAIAKLVRLNFMCSLS